MNILDSDKPHVGTSDSLADGFSISRIVLVGFDVRLNELRGHQLNRMPHRLKFSGPVGELPQASIPIRQGSRLAK